MPKIRKKYRVGCDKVSCVEIPSFDVHCQNRIFNAKLIY